MSIQTELTRLTNAKAAIKTAIEGKGVTVPNGTLLDGMAALIQAIQAGGGNIASGTISWATVTGAITNTEFVHNLGVVPILFIISPAFDISSNPSKTKKIGIHHIMTSSSSSLARYFNGELKIQSDNVYNVIRPMSEYSPSSYNGGVYVDENKAIYKTYIDSVFPVTAGDVYNWIVVG